MNIAMGVPVRSDVVVKQVWDDSLSTWVLLLRFICLSSNVVYFLGPFILKTSNICVLNIH
jgi:hypothetical protein